MSQGGYIHSTKPSDCTEANMVDNSWPCRVVSSGRIEEKRDRKNPAWLRAEQDLSSHILADVWSCFSQRACVGFLEVFFWLFTECSLHLDRCLSVPGVGRSLSTGPRDLALPSTPGASVEMNAGKPNPAPLFCNAHLLPALSLNLAALDFFVSVYHPGRHWSLLPYF